MPAGFNWDFWLGQTPQVEYVPERSHQTFRYWWDYSGGTMTDWGAHHNDIALWAIGLDGPTEIEAKALTEPIPAGTRRRRVRGDVHLGQRREAGRQDHVDDSPFGVALKPDGQRNGVKFEGTDGWIWVTRTTIKASDRSARHAADDAEGEALGQRRPHGQLLRGVRTRKDPISPVEAGHQSAVVGHLIVIALRTGAS